MDLLGKATIFATFAVPSIMCLGIAELIDKLSNISKILFYSAGGILGLLAVILPFVAS